MRALREVLPKGEGVLSTLMKNPSSSGGAREGEVPSAGKNLSDRLEPES